MTESVEKTLIFKLTSAAIVTAGLVATSITYFYENYRIPLKVLETTLQFKDVSETNDKLKNQIELEKTTHLETKSKLQKTEIDLGKLNERVITQSIAIKTIHQANLFRPNSFYPVGHGSPKLGDSVDDLKTIYSSDSLKWRNDDDSDWKVKVSIDNGYFDSIEYDHDEKTRKINAILFQAISAEDDVLLKLLSDIGGLPTKSKRSDIYRWKISDDVAGFLVNNRRYMIVTEGMTPLLWKEP